MQNNFDSDQEPSSGKRFLVMFNFAVIMGIIYMLAEHSNSQPVPSPAVEQRRQEDRWTAEGQISVKQRLKDPSSAQFRNVYFHRTSKGSPLVCGEVNAKNSFNGYAGFARFITNNTPELTILETDMKDGSFGSAWKELCQK